jgi:EmrB/QacA subfamily drug resistance transporter
MMSLLLAALDQTVVGTAMPRILADLNGVEIYAWVTTAYLVTSTVMTPIAGKLGDLFGRKPFLITGMLGFMAASWLCGFSQNMTELILFRGLQGIFGGLLFASVFTVLADIFPPAQRTRMQGAFGGVFGLASVLGPTVGGYLTDNAGWRWVFFVNVPVGLIGLVLVSLYLPYVRSKASWRDIDIWGALALTAGLVPLLIGLTITRDHSWTSPEVLGLLGVGFLMLIVFVVIEHFEPEPIVPLALFKNRVYLVGTIVGVLTAFGMFGSIIFTPLIFQGVLGVSATNSGQLITPMMFGLIGGSIVTGQLMVRIKQYRFLGTLGTLVMAVGTWWLSQVSIHSTQLEVTSALVLVGLGLGVTFPLYINALQSAVEHKYLGVVSSNTQFFRNLGGTVATAILGSILSNRLFPNIQARIDALHLPPQALALLPKGGSSNVQKIFDPATIAATKSHLSGPALTAYNQLLDAIRAGLADTTHEIFLIGLAFILLAAVASVFLPVVPLTQTAKERVTDPVEAPAPS